MVSRVLQFCMIFSLYVGIPFVLAAPNPYLEQYQRVFSEAFKQFSLAQTLEQELVDLHRQANGTHLSEALFENISRLQLRRSEAQQAYLKIVSPLVQEYGPTIPDAEALRLLTQQQAWIEVNSHPSYWVTQSNSTGASACLIERLPSFQDLRAARYEEPEPEGEAEEDPFLASPGFSEQTQLPRYSNFSKHALLLNLPALSLANASAAFLAYEGKILFLVGDLRVEEDLNFLSETPSISRQNSNSVQRITFLDFLKLVEQRFELIQEIKLSSWPHMRSSLYQFKLRENAPPPVQNSLSLDRGLRSSDDRILMRGPFGLYPKTPSYNTLYPLRDRPVLQRIQCSPYILGIGVQCASSENCRCNIM